MNKVFKKCQHWKWVSNFHAYVTAAFSATFFFISFISLIYVILQKRILIYLFSSGFPLTWKVREIVNQNGQGKSGNLAKTDEKSEK